MFKKFSFKVILAATAALIGIMPSAQADEGCGCAATSGAYVADSGCGSCGSGCGGNFLSKLRAKVNCDPAMRTGLWDGYCQERTACDSADTGCGGGLSLGCGAGLGCGTRGGCGFGSKLFSGGCGSFGGGTCGGSCFSPAVASCGCGHIFGGSSCFRNDGHFFGNFRRHQCGRRCAPAVQEIYAEPSCGEIAPAGCGCATRHRCNLFSGCRSKGGFFSRIKGLFGRSGSCGCGHFGGSCDSCSGYDVAGDCGCSQPATPSCGCNG